MGFPLIKKTEVLIEFTIRVKRTFSFISENTLRNDSLNRGNLRETFILNQLLVNHTVSYPDNGDFLVDGKYLIEVGGQSKKSKQITGHDNAYVAVDDTEFPDGRKTPLWLFGFLY